MSLIVVLTAVPARLVSVPFGDLAPYWYVVVNLLSSLLSAMVNQSSAHAVTGQVPQVMPTATTGTPMSCASCSTSPCVSVSEAKTNSSARR